MKSTQQMTSEMGLLRAVYFIIFNLKKRDASLSWWSTTLAEWYVYILTKFYPKT